ncbi:MAG: glycosyltransferase family 2 protein [Polyangiaceae bacterium]
MRAIAVIPAHDEASTIADVVRETLRYVDEVIVVDDGSSDATAALAEDAGASVSRLVPNRGKGGALSHGIGLALAKHPFAVVTLDADGEHDPSDIPRLLAALERADVALGVRHVYRSGARRWMNELALFWFKLLSPAIEDTICGLRAFRADKLPLLENAYGGFVYEHEVLIRAVMANLELAAVPIRTAPIATSHVTLREALRANNHFDRRVLGALPSLPIPLWRRALLGAGCVAGLAVGLPAEALLARSGAARGGARSRA